MRVSTVLQRTKYKIIIVTASEIIVRYNTLKQRYLIRYWIFLIEVVFQKLVIYLSMLPFDEILIKNSSEQ